MKKLFKILIVLTVLFTNYFLQGCTDLNDENSKLENSKLKIDKCDIGTPEERNSCRE